MLTSSPFHIPNSQAPIPGREVYWDLDTPQSRKYREALVKEFEESDSPVSKHINVTPKMRMVAKTRIDTVNSNEVVRKGEEAMQMLLDMCREKEEEAVEKIKKIEPVCQLKMDNLSMERKEETKEEEADDMFADDFELGDTLDFGVEEEIVLNKVNTDLVKDNSDMLDKALDSDMFDDDDESFLLQATQAAETDLVTENVVTALIKTEQTFKPSAVHRTDTSVKQGPQVVVGNVRREIAAKQEPVKMKTEPKVTHLAISRVQAQVSDGFGSEDDSFDEILSQMEEPLDVEVTPASPILKRKRKCFDLSAATKPHHPLPLSELNRQVPVVPGPGTTAQNRQAGGTFRKFSSYDNKEEKKAFPRMISDPNTSTLGTLTSAGTSNTKVVTVERVGSMVNMVGQSGNGGPSKPTTRSCTKEDIERKRKEAMARRQQSQSQGRR